MCCGKTITMLSTEDGEWKQIARNILLAALLGMVAVPENRQAI